MLSVKTNYYFKVGKIHINLMWKTETILNIVE